MVIRLLIADSDGEYLERLAQKLEEREDLAISEYTDSNSLIHAIENKKVDILLFSADMIDDAACLKNVTMPILLVDESGTYPKEFDNCHKTRKYQRISSIYREIIAFYSEVSGEVGTLSDIKKRARIISFFSPAGGTGKTTLALSMANALTRNHRKVLYLNFEQISSDASYLPQIGGHGLSELAASLDENINYQLKLQGLLKEKDGFYYLNHFDTPKDLTEITVEELEKLIKICVESHMFEFVILDMDSVLNDKTHKMLEVSDEIYVVLREGQTSGEKIERFKTFSYLSEDFADKFKYLINQMVTNNANINSSVNVAAHIRLVPEVDEGRIIEKISNNNEFVNLVNSL